MTEQERLKKLSKRIGNGYPNGVWWNERKERFVRVYRTQSSKHIKKNCNKRLRKKDVGNFGNYKKATEFWHNYC